MRVDLLADALAAGLRPKLVYLTPTFANPSGTTMPAAAARSNWPPSRIATASSSPRTTPTASCTSARRRRARSRRTAIAWSGWVRSPRCSGRGCASAGSSRRPTLRSAFVRAKQATDLHTSTFAQRLLHAAASDSGLLADHLAATRASYAERAATLVHGLRSGFGDRLEARRPAGRHVLLGDFRRRHLSRRVARRRPGARASRSSPAARSPSPAPTAAAARAPAVPGCALPPRRRRCCARRSVGWLRPPQGPSSD